MLLLIGPICKIQRRWKWREWMWPMGPYSQHFFVTYEWTLYAKALLCTRPERIASDQHSRLLGPFMSYWENTVLWIRPWNCIHNILFFVTYEWTQYAKVLHNTRQERLVSDQHSSLLGLFMSYWKNKVLWRKLRDCFTTFIFIRNLQWTH
jgi:hypothetical protein